MSARISIAIPTHDNVPALWAYDLASMMAYTAAVMPDDVELGINMSPGTYVHAARNELAEAMVKQGTTHVLWMDSDMRFPRDSLIRLLQHDLDMVGINYAKRGIPTGYVAIAQVGLGERGLHLATTEESTGLEECAAIGFGLVLMKTRVFKDLPDPAVTPWFDNVYLGGGNWMGEDVTFCEHVRKAGYKIWVDHDLSKKCGHLGQFEYKLEHVEAQYL